jgi:hypothetical protein
MARFETVNIGFFADAKIAQRAVSLLAKNKIKAELQQVVMRVLVKSPTRKRCCSSRRGWALAIPSGEACHAERILARHLN